MNQKAQNDKFRLIDPEQVTYVIQRRSQETGEWQTLQSPIIGWSNAFIALERYRALAELKGVDVDYRAVSKREAEKYREAWQDALAYARQGRPRRAG